jgi:tartrate-resistant acid phosphatase type 5
VTIGDWGGSGVDAEHARHAKEVGDQLAVGAKTSKFVINVGDNHYYKGVESVSDSMWKINFEDVYTSAQLNIPWYSVLGNHDYGVNPQAQVDYHSPNNDRWQMPARYFTQRFAVGERSNGKTKHATFVFLDTSPCVADYRGDDPDKYTPGAYAPEFHPNIMKQDCGDQFKWLKGVLAGLESTSEWVIVVGHHPINEVDFHDFKGVLESSPMSVYLTGHLHRLRAFTYSGHPHQTHILSGAGCMIKNDAVSNNETLYGGKDVQFEAS